MGTYSAAKCGEAADAITADIVKVSVIMGVYNPDREKLECAVQSIIEQTMRQWEMFLYDDGSSPAYANMIRKVAFQDRRIRYVRHEKNKGLAYALNRCIRWAKGEFIARMDDDDWSDPERFAQQVSFLIQHNEYDWVGSNADLFDGKRIWGRLSMPEYPSREDFLRYSPYVHPSVIFRRSVFERHYGYISHAVTRRCEDYELFMRLHTKGERGYNIQEPLLTYREDETAYAKRNYICRLNEMRIRYRGFKRLGILKLSTLPYVFRPAAGALIPTARMMHIIRRKLHGSSSDFGS